MLNFEAFHKFQSILEDLNKEYDSFAINEAFSSSILSKLAAQESGTQWRGSFAKDFYKHAGIPLDKITNEDFIILNNPSEWWTQKYAKNDSAIGFFVDDNPELFKAWDKNLEKRMEQSGKKMKLGKVLRNAQGVGLILTIARGKVGMWYGFAQDAGSKYSRFRKSSAERYGVLADQWETDSKYRYAGMPSPDAKITRKNLELIATKVYVLDMEALREKYGATNSVRAERAAAKQGAIAMMSDEAFKKQQISRYNKILQERLDPKQMLDDVKKAMAGYLTWFTKKVDEIDFNPDKYDGDWYQKSKVQWGSWQEDMTRPVMDMWRLIEKFMREYDNYLRDQSYVEKATKQLKDEKDETKKARLQSEIDYYAKSYERFVKRAITYRDDLNQTLKKVQAITG